MNEQDIRSRIDQRWGEQKQKSRKWVGLFFVLVGGVLLARAAGVIFPIWFFSWPMILIGIGLFSGVRHGFRGFGWMVPLIIGVIFLIDRLSPYPSLKEYLWPIAFIAIGFLFIFRPKKNRWLHESQGFESASPGNEQAQLANDNPRSQAHQSDYKGDWQSAMNDRSDVIDATAVFGGIKKNVLSKNFKGGDVTTFMGGAEINLSQADCNGRVVIDCFNMFGGTKLIVPPDWDVQSDLVSIFGGIEDKRQPAQVNPTKVLYLDGTCIFGGVEIKSF